MVPAGTKALVPAEAKAVAAVETAACGAVDDGTRALTGSSERSQSHGHKGGGSAHCPFGSC